MHRSGTSALTNAIRLLGCSFGDAGDFIGRKHWNPEGHWEHQRLIELDERILELHGGTWFAPPRLRGNWERRRKAQAMLPRLRSEFAEIYPEEGWVWKDPRICLTLPIWLRAWSSAPVAVMAFRHPLAVARSLAARNRFSLRHGLALWEIYNAQALWNLREVPTLVCDYDSVLDDPPRFVEELSDTLAAHGVALDGSAAAAADALKPSLRRNRAEEAELGTLGERQRRLWELLNARAAGESSPVEESLARQSPATRAALFAKVPLGQRAILARARLRPGLGRSWAAIGPQRSLPAR
jgi:hypothetical protein